MVVETPAPSPGVEGSARAPLLIATSFLALFAIVGLCLYGLPFYYDFYVRELGWTRAQVTSGNAYSKLVVGPMFGFLAGWLVDRVGPRPLMITGILLAGVGLYGLGGVTALPYFVAFYLLNSLAYVLAGPLPNQVLLSRNFSLSRGRAMGMAYLGIGLGGFAAPHISQRLIDALGWRDALRAFGAIAVVIALPLVLALSKLGTAARALSSAQKPSIKGPLTTASFYLLAFGSMASIGAVGGAFQNLKLYLTLDQHRTAEQAAWIMSLILAVSLIGRVLAGVLADRYGPKRVMLLVYLLVTSATIFLATGPTGDAIYVFVVLFGLGLGGEYLIIPLVAVELFGAVVLGSVMGIVLTADGVAEAVVPMLVGSLRDETGSYTLSFQLLAGLSALGAVAVALLPERGPFARPRSIPSEAKLEAEGSQNRASRSLI
jgi:MFS family permease